jgi:hypothetical protein
LEQAASTTAVTIDARVRREILTADVSMDMADLVLK